MSISIIIPTYNEAEGLGLLLSYLQRHSSKAVKEIIVSDGGSSDGTVTIANNCGVQVVGSPRKGRAAQMNYGALFATGEIFYFLHADTFPPQTFARQIMDAQAKGFASGCFRLCFNHSSLFLKANCWFTRFDVNAIRFGDQSLFVTREAFEIAGRFNEGMMVLEDQEIIRRIRRQAKFIVLQDAVVSSARKYVINGVLKTQAIYFLIYFMYKAGFSQQKMVSTYRKLIKQDKL